MSIDNIICDPGTGFMKIGYSGDNFPRNVFPALIGRPMLRYQEKFYDIQLKPIMIGQEAKRVRPLLELSHPTSQAIIKNKEDMELLLKYSFKSIGAEQTKGKSILITEAVNNPVKNRQILCQMIFQKFEFQRLTFGIQALMLLFAKGIGSGFLVDSGDGVTHCIPIYQYQILKMQADKLKIAGSHITNRLIKLLLRRGYAFNSSADYQLIQQIKQKYCFVSGDWKLDSKLANQTTFFQKVYQLPDGSKIRIGRERFEAPEIIFNPGVAGLDMIGISQMIYKSIDGCPIQTRGTSMLPGYPTRMKEDLRKLFKEKKLKGKQQKENKINVMDYPNRKYYVFVGASYYGQQIKNFPDAWVSRKEYNQNGIRALKKLTQ